MADPKWGMFQYILRQNDVIAVAYDNQSVCTHQKFIKSLRCSGYIVKVAVMHSNLIEILMNDDLIQ